MIQIMKRDVKGFSVATLKLLMAKILLASALVSVIGASATPAQAQPGSRLSKSPSDRIRSSESQIFEELPVKENTELRSDISLAREKAREAKKKFKMIQKLSRLGSASQKQLRDAELRKWLALLELSTLVSPEKAAKNSVLRAKLVFSYRSKELEVIRKLYERGSASKLSFDRAKTNRDIAESQLKAIQSASSAQRKINVIGAASLEYEEARKEYELAAKLYQSGSISQAAMERAERNLESAKSKLADAKDSLGARASQVGQ